jgi:hypothetical protein
LLLLLLTPTADEWGWPLASILFFNFHLLQTRKMSRDGSRVWHRTSLRFCWSPFFTVSHPVDRETFCRCVGSINVIDVKNPGITQCPPPFSFFLFAYSCAQRFHKSGCGIEKAMDVLTVGEEHVGFGSAVLARADGEKLISINRKSASEPGAMDL